MGGGSGTPLYSLYIMPRRVWLLGPFDMNKVYLFYPAGLKGGGGGGWYFPI